MSQKGKKEEEPEVTEEQKKVMTTQDIKYVEMKRLAEVQVSSHMEDNRRWKSVTITIEREVGTYWKSHRSVMKPNLKTSTALYKQSAVHGAHFIETSKNSHTKNEV